jgi:CheY-like chemotaxis protein
MTILVVEDNDQVRDVITLILAAHGYDVAVASNGMEALEFLHRRKDVDLVLSDVQMPLLDGWHLRDTMLSNATLALVPIVMMTSEMTPSSSDVPLLRKPFGTHELLETVRTQCRKTVRRIEVMHRQQDRDVSLASTLVQERQRVVVLCRER